MPINWAGYRDSVEPYVADQMDEYIGPLPDLYQCTAGGRTIAQECALYQHGRTPFASQIALLASDPKASIIDPEAVVTWSHPTNSAHIITATHKGLAGDFVPVEAGGTLSWDYTLPAYQRLMAAVRASPTLHSGADFPEGETDPPHVELVDWHSYTPPQPEHAA